MDRIADLTAEQAQRALANLYGLLPDDWWEDGKPTPAEIKGLAEEVPDQLSSLEREADTRGEVARVLLRGFEASSAATDLVGQAIDDAVAARLAPLPLLIVPLLVVLAGMNLDIKVGDSHVKLKIAGSGKDLLKNLSGFAASLPKAAWAALAALMKGTA